MKISPEVQKLADECAKTRRSLHMIPESAFNEHQTQRFVKEKLASLSPDVLTEIAGTGIKAVWYAKHAQRTVAFRADIDALKINEESEAEYRSRHEGRMHGCGHDGHMAVLIMLAKLVSENRDTLTQNIVCIFQPAEEGRAGSRMVIADGALKDPDVDIIYGLHLWPDIEKGKTGIRWGAMMARTCELDFNVYGLSAHGASPQKGVDAVVAAAEFISVLQTAITRNIDPLQDALLTIGKIEGGSARNVIADKVVMCATLRVFVKEVYDQLMRHIKAIADGLGTALGAKFEIKEYVQYPSVDNPRALVEDFYTYADMDDMVLVGPSMAGEDFAFYQQEVPGLFFFLGIGGGKNNQPLHSATFDFDEDALLGGIEIFKRIAFGQRNAQSANFA